MAMIMQHDVSVTSNYIKVGDVKVAKIINGELTFMNYRKPKVYNCADGTIRKDKSTIDIGKAYKVEYFKEWLMKSQTKKAKELTGKYL